MYFVESFPCRSLTLSVVRKIFPYIPMRGSQVKVMSEPSALCIPFSLEVSAFQRQRVDPVTLKLYIPDCHLPMDKSDADRSDWNVASRPSVSEYWNFILITIYILEAKREKLTHKTA